MSTKKIIEELIKEDKRTQLSIKFGVSIDPYFENFLRKVYYLSKDPTKNREELEKMIFELEESLKYLKEEVPKEGLERKMVFLDLFTKIQLRYLVLNYSLNSGVFSNHLIEMIKRKNLDLMDTLRKLAKIGERSKTFELYELISKTPREKWGDILKEIRRYVPVESVEDLDKWLEDVRIRREKLKEKVDEEVLNYYNWLVKMQKRVYDIILKFEELINERYQEFMTKDKRYIFWEWKFLMKNLLSKYYFRKGIVYWKGYLINTNNGEVLKIKEELKNYFESLSRHEIIGDIYLTDLYKIIKWLEEKEYLINYPPWEEKFDEWKIYIEPTIRCNFNCKFCFNRDHKRYYELSGDSWKNFFEILPKNSRIILFGGEPFLYKDIKEIVRYAWEKGFKITILTNGYHLDKHIHWLKDLEGVLVEVSLDGPYEINTKQRHPYFEKVIENIKKAVDNCITVRVKVLKTRINKDSIREFLKILDEIGVSAVFFGDLVPTRFEDQRYLLSFENDFSITKEIIEISKELKNLKAYPKEDWREPKYFQPNTCGLGRELIYIRSDGRVTSCTMLGNMIYSEKTVGEISSFEEVLEEVPEIFKRLGKLSDICKKCPILSVCLGGCRGRAFYMTGNIDGCDVYRKEHIERFLDWVIENAERDSSKSWRDIGSDICC